MTDLSYPPGRDTSVNIIAQRYFLADAWRWPPLTAANLAGPTGGSNIGLLDGIPLAALPLKLIAAHLPPAFHAVNSWYGVTWLLQPVAAVWCLRGAGERRLLPAIAMAVVAVSMPAWWNRFGHAALCSHFLILAALGTYLRLVARPTASWRLWAGAAVLEAASLLVHPYLALMVLAVVGAAPLTVLLRRDRGWPLHALGFAGAAASLVLGLWSLDYLGVTGGFGFGSFAMDALSPFWPHGSVLLPMPMLGNWEGYNYLGAGLLFGMLCAVVLRAGAAQAMIVRHAGLALALGGLTLLALSQRPSVGGHVLFDLGLAPDWLENLRSTGRFFWPVAYALAVGTMVLLARHRHRWVATGLPLVVAALQFVEVAGMREGVRWKLPEPTASSWTIDAPAFRASLAGARSMTLLPSWYCVPPEVDPTAEQTVLLHALLLASETVVPASTMDVARHHGQLHCDDGRLAAAPLGRGELRLLTPAAQAAYLPLVPRSAEFCKPMGQAVVCRDPDATGGPPTEEPLGPALRAGEAGFGTGDAGTAMLGPGWSSPEDLGVWSDGDVAVLRAQRPPELSGPLRLDFRLLGFASDEDASQHVEIRLNGERVERANLPDHRTRHVEVEVPPGDPGPFRLEFRIAAPFRPVDRGQGEDPRLLGVQLQSVRVKPYPPLAAGTASFGRGGDGLALLDQGWSAPEPSGVWSDGERATLSAERPASLAGPLRLEFRLEGYAAAAGGRQRVELWAEGERVEGFSVRDRQVDHVRADLPAGDAGPLELELRIAEPTRPVDRGLGTDPRRLGVRLIGLTVGTRGS